MKLIRIQARTRKLVTGPKPHLYFALIAILLAGFALPASAAAGVGVFHATAMREASANPGGRAQLGRQLAEQTREAAGEDDQGQFKHSPAVQFIARVTGLSLQHAYWLCILLNFAIVIWLILWISKKNLPTVFRNRTAAIQKAMEEARRASEDANRRLKQIEERLSRLDAEIGAIRGANEKEAAAEEEKIKAAAEDDARKIVESAEQEIAAAAKSARRELTRYAADLAVALARKQIHVDPVTDQSLVRNFAQQLSENGGDTAKGRR